MIHTDTDLRLFHTSPVGFKDEHSHHVSSKSYLFNSKQTIYKHVTDSYYPMSIHADFNWHLALSWICETNSWTSFTGKERIKRNPFLISQGDVSYCDVPSYRPRAVYRLSQAHDVIMQQLTSISWKRPTRTEHLKTKARISCFFCVPSHDKDDTQWKALQLTWQFSLV
jgi:hypothetical protein